MGFKFHHVADGLTRIKGHVDYSTGIKAVTTLSSVIDAGTAALEIRRHIKNNNPKELAGSIGKVAGIIASDFAAGFLIGLAGIETGPGVILTSLGCGVAFTFLGKKTGQKLLAKPVEQAMNLIRQQAPSNKTLRSELNPNTELPSRTRDRAKGLRFLAARHKHPQL